MNKTIAGAILLVLFVSLFAVTFSINSAKAGQEPSMLGLTEA